MSFMTGAVTIAAMFPLFSVLYMLLEKGGAGLNLSVLTPVRPIWFAGELPSSSTRSFTPAAKPLEIN